MGRHGTIGRPGQFAQFKRESLQTLERAALVSSDRAAHKALAAIRPPLGKLGNALGAGSDLKKGRGVHRTGAGGFSASGWVHIRSKSERAVGAIIAYTEGADISPRRGRWLWISTDEIPRRAGRYRMTPELYRKTGLESRIGPLVFAPGRHAGEALYLVRDVTVDRFGRAGKARRLPKRGAIGSSRQRQDFIVAFVGIRRTSRSARVDPHQIFTLEQARLPEYRAAAVASITTGR